MGEGKGEKMGTDREMHRTGETGPPVRESKLVEWEERTAQHADCLCGISQRLEVEMGVERYVNPSVVSQSPGDGRSRRVCRE